MYNNKQHRIVNRVKVGGNYHRITNVHKGKGHTTLTLKSEQAEHDPDPYPKSKDSNKPLYIQMRKNPERFLDESKMWVSKEYVKNNLIRRRLSIGDLVFVHPEISMMGEPVVGIVWYHRKSEGSSLFGVMVKILENRLPAVKHNLWVDDDSDIIKYIHPDDEWVTDNVFTRLEPVQWWVGKNATVNSPLFTTMAALINFDIKYCYGLP